MYIYIYDLGLKGLKSLFTQIELNEQMYKIEYALCCAKRA